MSSERASSFIRTRAMLAAGFVLLTGLLVGAYALSTVRESTVQGLQKAISVRNALTRVLLSIGDAESAQRGYLLTGQEAYLTPYHAATKDLPAVMRELDQLIVDRPDRLQLVQLQGLLQAKLGEVRHTLGDYRQGRATTAMRVVRSNVGMDLMTRIRVLVGTMEADYDRRAAVRRARAETISRWLLIGELASACAIVLLAALTLLALSRRHRMVVRMRDELLCSNQALKESAERQSVLEDAVRQSRKMEALGALTGGMAHDFNNMLAVVMGNLELIRARVAAGRHDIERHVEHALDATRRASELTRRLLAFARRQPLRPVAVQLDQVVAGIAEVIGRTLGEIYPIRVIQQRGLWPAVVDVNQLENALINLAVNARDAMPGGGKLSIETSNALLDEGYASQHPDVAGGQYVLIAVTDNGQGMSPDTAAKAFDPFFTTKEVGRGTGLGLSQVYGFVKQSGGHVDLSSEERKGTTVRIYLPRARPDALERAEHGALSGEGATLPRGDARTTVLLVEDDADVRAFTTEALAELGYSVMAVPSGHSALAAIETDPTIRLLLTDIVMAEMTGKQLADLAMTMRPDLKVLYMTGYTRDEISHDNVLDQNVQLLAKPFSLEQLARGIQTALAG